MIRPFRTAEEAIQLRQVLHLETNTHWGPGWSPLAKCSQDFAEHGLMDGENLHQFAIVSLAGDELVGVEQCGLCGKNGIEAWFGTFIHFAHRGQGYGTEAKQLMMCFIFENFPVNRLISDTVVHHVAARRGMERCGMKLEGYLRASHVIDGQWYDLPWYRILRSEWETLPIRHSIKRGM
jgi:RimJ/RimL family protein N-acetyltransferase